MALQMTITETVKTTVSGSLIKTATPVETEVSHQFYCKVNKIYGSKYMVTFSLSYLSDDGVDDNPDSETYQQPIRGKSYVTGKEYSFVPDNSDGAKNWLAQAYDHLKTLPEFASATDV